MKKSTAIMFTDIVGYSAIMSTNEDQAIQLIEQNREIHGFAFKKFDGTQIKEIGDGVLSTFDSVSAAVDCAKVVISQSQSQGFEIKVGINYGEVTIDENDVFGDSVNIASRLESISTGSCILISDIANSLLKNNQHIQTVSIGKFVLKNIEDPIEIFAVKGDKLVIPKPENLHGKATPKKIPNNLPRLDTEFIGRKHEIEKLKVHLEKHTLVTLYGAGGSGKTRLAIETAYRWIEDYPDGVFFIDLAPIDNRNIVVNIIADILSVPEEAGVKREESISKLITNKACLVIVDNCEHLIGSCAQLLDHLSKETSKPTFLATSRELLNIQNEYSLLIPTLSLNRLVQSGHSRASDAAQLFENRAKNSRPDFELSPTNENTVNLICEKLDGIPLALELAASRLNMMDVGTLLDRINKQFNILKKDDRSMDMRHRTIEATIAWSHQLLSEEEQILFNRLSIFNGDFDLDAAENVCGFEQLPSEDILDLIGQLINKSMLIPVHQDGSAVRYRMLELMKEFGKKMVLEDRKNLEESLVNYYLKMGEQANREKIERGDFWKEQMDREDANILGALNLLKNDSKRLMLLGFFFSWGWFEKDQPYIPMEYLIPCFENYHEEDDLKAKTLSLIGAILVRHGDFTGGYDYMTRGIAMLKGSIDNKEKAEAFLNGILIYVSMTEFENAWNLLRVVLRISDKLNDPYFHMRVAPYLGVYYLYQHKTDEAEPIIEEALSLARKFSSNWDILINSHMHADIPLVRGEYPEAEKRYQQATQVAKDLGNEFQMLSELQGVAMSLAAQGKIEKSLKLWGSVTKGFQEAGLTPPAMPFWTDLQKKTILSKMEELGETESKRLLDLGRELTIDQTFDYAMDSSLA